MEMIEPGEVTLHYRLDGDPGGAPLVFANSLGTDLRLWDKILPRLPEGLRILRYDMRGHGLSGCPRGDYTMDQLVDDAARLLQALDLRGCLFVGLSIGGLVAQGLAARHPGLVRALVISNSAASIGSAGMWRDRIATLRADGIEAIADDIMQRWFARAFHEQHALELRGWRNMLTRTPLDGYIGCCAAIAAADLTAATAKLTLPTLAIAGSEDGSTPPEVVRATAASIRGAGYAQIDDAGHVPCIEKPQTYARLLAEFIAETGHA